MNNNFEIVLKTMRKNNINWTKAFLETKVKFLSNTQIVECLHVLVKEFDERPGNE